MSEDVKHCFVIPVYNHPHYLESLVQYLNQFQLPIIMVNDGSEQECTNLLREIASKNNLVKLVEHEINQGKGQAVITGIFKAKELGYSHALQLDSDGQHDWNDIQKFIDASTSHPQAMVIGNPVYDASVPKLRLYGRYATHIWVWINSLSFEIKDSMCGFRIYPVQSTVKVLEKASFQLRMSFDIEILVRLKWDNVPFVNVPTQVIYPENGISHFNALRDNIGLTKAHSKLFAGMLVRLPRLIYQKIKSAE